MKYFFGNLKLEDVDIKAFVKNLKKITKEINLDDRTIMFAPQPLYLLGKCRLLKVAQNVSIRLSGAFTGELSINALKDNKIKYAIVGHSECRKHFFETDLDINTKVTNLIKSKITPILCIGENAFQHKKEITMDVLLHQLKYAFYGLRRKQIEKVIVAYEPIWAIGTGETATPEYIKDTFHTLIYQIDKIYGTKVKALLYGGSVNPNNIHEIFYIHNLDGVLVGKASSQIESLNTMLRLTCKKER